MMIEGDGKKGEGKGGVIAFDNTFSGTRKREK
jgi:hypothetical protein